MLAGGRSVTGFTGGRRLGFPDASYPCSTWAFPRSGRYFKAGSSSCTFPRSTSCIAAVAAMALVMEAIEKMLSGLTSMPEELVALAESAGIKCLVRGGGHRGHGRDFSPRDSRPQRFIDAAGRSREFAGPVTQGQHDTAELSTREGGHNLL